VPNGSTALRDAVGYTIQKLMDTTDTSDENAAYLLIVISDGQNTDNGPYTVAALKEMIDACQKTGRWTITYLGCSESYLQQLSRETGVSASNMAAWSNASADKARYGLHATALRTSSYLSDRSTGITSSATYMNDQEGKVANFVSSGDENLNVYDDGHKIGDLVNQSTSAPKIEKYDIKFNEKSTPFLQGQGQEIGMVPKDTSITPGYSVLLNANPSVEPPIAVNSPTKSIEELRNTMGYNLGKQKNGGSVFSNSATVCFTGSKTV
jgi:hypothetical protein